MIKVFLLLFAMPKSKKTVVDRKTRPIKSFNFKCKIVRGAVRLHTITVEFELDDPITTVKLEDPILDSFGILERIGIDQEVMEFADIVPEILEPNVLTPENLNIQIEEPIDIETVSSPYDEFVLY